MEFHISRQVRDRYQFDQSLFRLSGNVIFANFHAVRLFVQKMNQKNDLLNFPERAVKAGQINAMGLIDEILHYVISLYRRHKSPLVIDQALKNLDDEFGKDEVDKTLLQFIKDFPPLAVYRHQQAADAYLQDTTESVSNREIALEELLMLWLENKNPAFTPYGELFDDSDLQHSSSYRKIIQVLHDFFDNQPGFGPKQQNLIDMLRSPAVAVPHSLSGQLEYIRQHWADLLGDYFYRLLSSLDLIQEEEKMRFPGAGEIPIPYYDLAASEFEPERFSTDKDWMPSLVLIAKNTYVWLNQLGKKYQRPITRIDHIPDEELDNLARWGFTGLWFIGIWERSPASARIKQMCGNPEAISSAYSLSSYSIAADLGGEEAYQRLKERARQHGIRLASDMVPNHMGIDSPWVIEHPSWFVSLDYPPFPSYSYNGANLSPDPSVSIYIEDHYYDSTDAAVTFKRVDNNSGYTKYIYHGNDGTSMPWNDTAQLNYLKPEVREAVLRTILDVARRFSIIRFDAAMTLTKRHYQRLWFPEPGSGGDIPSRAEYGLSRQQFDKLIPQEFWREVVDRVAAEAPDTLLLAEAFWLMEGYFVRSLGMHRVYNSAFMNMLRDEDNAKYRNVMKNTLEFDPQILKRFVNFMNNPDERTAVDQFGKGDKYFGICTLMATLPGLPMFGHGQIEGFTEKYGMEYRRAYWEEIPDGYLVERHQREIFPLLHRRRIFAGVENFLLYDFFTPEGQVNENVFAFSNGYGSERSLVVYHNRYASTEGWIRTSVAYSHKSPGGDRQLIQRTLAEGLNIQPINDQFVIARDHISGLEYLYPSHEVADKGIFLHLDAYKYHVFLDFRQVMDDQWHPYRRLYEYLGGHGVPNMEEALRQLLLQPVIQPFEQIANAGYFGYLLQVRNEIASQLPRKSTAKPFQPPQHLLDEAASKMSALLDGITFLTQSPLNKEEILNSLCQKMEILLTLAPKGTPFTRNRRSNAAMQYLYSRLGLKADKANWLVIFGWLFVHDLARDEHGDIDENLNQSRIDEWQLGKLLAQAYQQLGIKEEESWQMVATVRLLIGLQLWYSTVDRKSLHSILESWLTRIDVQSFLGINRYQGILWYNAEAFSDFTWWLMMLAFIQIASNPQLKFSEKIEEIQHSYHIIRKLVDSSNESDYQVGKLLELTCCK